jgi:hypothetical protein
MDEGGSARLFRPENVNLTRVSYMFFGFYPGYFSHSPMDAPLETRLIDPKSMAVLADGSTTVSGERPPGSNEFDLRYGPSGLAEAGFPIGPAQTDVIRFDYLGREPAGLLQITGRTLNREYHLPSSGEGRSFGSGPTNSRVIAIQNTDSTPDWVSMRFYPDSGADGNRRPTRTFARVSVEPLGAGDHVIALRSLLPFHATVRSDRPALLETPRVYVPNYRARVNGRIVPVVRSGEGMVGVEVSAGESDVIVDYPGSLLQRASYFAGIGAWLALALCAVAVPLADPSGRLRKRLESWTQSRRIARILPPLALACVLVPLGVLWTRQMHSIRRTGALRLVVKLPIGTAKRGEPLVTTGRTGAGDVVYVKYLGEGRVSVGHDYWGVGGAESKPFAVDFLVPQIIEISMRSLAQQKPQANAPDEGPHGVLVRWNGNVILSDSRDSYPPGPEKVEVGANMIGATTSVPAFTGEILEAGPIEPRAN